MIKKYTLFLSLFVLILSFGLFFNTNVRSAEAVRTPDSIDTGCTPNGPYNINTGEKTCGWVGMGASLTPSQVTGLTATANGTSVQLSWSPATSNDTGIVSYNIYRSIINNSSSLVGQVKSPALSYADTTNPGTYNYTVAAVDSIGQTGPVSSQVQVVVAYPSVSRVTNLSATVSRSTVNLSFFTVMSKSQVYSFNIYRSPTANFTPGPSNLIVQELWGMKLCAGSSCSPLPAYSVSTPMQFSVLSPDLGTYYYAVIPIDFNGQAGSASNQVKVAITNSPSIPSQVTNLTATLSGNVISLSWSSATSSAGIDHYNIYRVHSLNLSPKDYYYDRIGISNSISFQDTTFNDSYVAYVVTAINRNQEESIASNLVKVQIASSDPYSNPGQVTGLTATVSGSSVNLSWSAATGVGIAYYDIYRGTTSNGGMPIGTVSAYATTLSYTDNPPGPGTYYYSVDALNQHDLRGSVSNSVQVVVTAINSHPSVSQVTGLTATVSGSSVNLSWSAATANGGIVGYNIFESTIPNIIQDFSYGGPNFIDRVLVSKGLSVQEKGLPPGTYYFNVVAEGPSQIMGLASNQVQAIVANPLAPSKVTNLSATVSGSFLSHTAAASLSWSPATSNSDVGIDYYWIYRNYDEPTNNKPFYSVRSSPYTDTSMALNYGPTAYYYGVAAQDKNGNVGPISQIHVVVGDLSLPDPITNLSATVSGTSVQLSWSKATAKSNVGGFSYNIYRSNTPNFVPGPSNFLLKYGPLSYTDFNLNPGTYYYAVSAVGDFGEEGSASQVQAVVTSKTGTAAYSELSTAYGNPYTFSITSGPANTVGSLVVLSGTGASTAKWFTTDADGNATKGPWSCSSPKTDVIYIQWPDGTKTNQATHTCTVPQVQGASAFHFTQFLTLGSSGNEVTELQNKLTTLGDYSGAVDGKFGPLTESAVLKFQTDHQLAKLDGKVGATTRALLNQ